MRIFHLKMDIDTEMCMTYVTCARMYNEGGEGSIRKDPSETTNSFTEYHT